jgi:hypothetical protein
MEEELRRLYLDLVKRCILGLVYQDAPMVSFDGWGLFRMLMGRKPRYSAASREAGRDWPNRAHSMIGLKRMDNLQACMEQVIADNIQGDCIETGVWRGGAAIFMRAILKAYGIEDRCVWFADSFEGLPPPNAKSYPQDKAWKFNLVDELAVSLEQVQNNVAAYGLLDDQVKFLKGWFSQTLPNAPIEQLALLRLDGDLYESTMDALTNLYPKLSVGGFIIIDDYGIPPCKEAVGKYRKDNAIEDEIKDIDNMGVYWRRT